MKYNSNANNFFYIRKDLNLLKMFSNVMNCMLDNNNNNETIDSSNNNNNKCSYNDNTS